MNNPKLSLIIGVNHESKYYRELVQQAQRQDYDNLEIIIVSNRLNTKEQYILDFLTYRDSLERTKHICLINRRCHSSIYNEGINLATGDYIWCVNENIALDDEKIVSRVICELVKSKAQAIYLVESKGPTESASKANKSGKETYEACLEHPASLINQKDWKNPGRLIINLSTLRLFNLRFVEEWSDIHGALLALQVIRFFPNIVYLSQDTIKFNKNPPRYSLGQFVEFKLAYNYVLRFSEIVFGIHSNIFKIVLKGEIKDCPDFINSIDSSPLNQKIKDYLKYSRKLCLEHYTKRAFDITDETVNIHEKIKTLTTSVVSKYSEMMNEFFKNSKIKVHCGAHKTATTFIQNRLHEAKYDLALQNTIYIHYEQLRDDYIRAKQVKNIDDINERFAFAISQQVAILAFKTPSILIISEENLIRPNIQITEKWGSEATYERASNYSCACMRNGYDIEHLKEVLSIFQGQAEIIYTVRNYFDYLLSRHSELLKWRNFKEFDGEFLNKSDLKQCNWDFLISDLKRLGNTTSIFAFETYKNDPIQFANHLAEYDLTDYCVKQNDSQNISRSRSSQLLLDSLINKQYLGYEPLELKNIFSEKIACENSLHHKFETKLFSHNLLQQSKSQYNAFCINKTSNLIDSHPPLSHEEACESRLLKEISLPERNQYSFIHNSKALEIHLKSISKRLLFLEERCKASPPRDGLSAMIRIKNEEDNIYNVLVSIRDHFDEIVVIDNNSTDNTLSEIERAMTNHPSLNNKLKIRHYKYEIARCGIDNFKEPQNSPHSLASFYNYCLKQCSFSKVCKWDGDMLLPKSMEEAFAKFISKLKTTLPSSDESTVFGVMKGMTVYKGGNGKFYRRHSVFEKEARIFDNSPGVFFIKEILWEQLYSLHKIERITSDDITFVEFKDTSVNEFSHWSIESSLGMSPRKSKELRDFNLIKQITNNKNIKEMNNSLASHGFQEIDFSIFEFE